MHHPGDQRLPTLSLLLIITSFTLIYVPKAFCQNQQYVTCGEPYQCGNINFTYPFWGGDRPETCGYPGFNVSCQGNVPRIGVEPVLYRVLATDTTTAHTLTVARDDLWSNNCPIFLHNTTLNFNIFSYSNNVENITLSYNCNSNIPFLIPPLNEFNCTQNSTTPTASYFSTNIASNANTSLVTCTDSIRVPVNQAAVQSLVNTTALRNALVAGFSLQYSANNSICSNCTGSDGRCGYNTGANSFACYCSDGEYNLVCNSSSTQSQNGMRSSSDSLAPNSFYIGPVDLLVLFADWSSLSSFCSAVIFRTLGTRM